MQRQDRHRVVILGGGFAGLETARALRRTPVDVTLVDRRNHHLFQPLLYQVATGGLSPANIAAPLRFILRRQKNCRVLLAEAVGIDPSAQVVHFKENGSIRYDSLVVGTGSHPSYFGHDHWGEYAPGLKSIDDATEIRRRIFLTFEQAERQRGAIATEALNFVIVGGGPTGVELAGAIAEIARETLRHEFRCIDPTQARIVIVESDERVLPTYPAELSMAAEKGLRDLGVQVMTGARVTEIHGGGVDIETNASRTTIATRNVFWAAGVKASMLAQVITEQFGARCDRGGRIFVEPDFSVPGHPELFVVGDLAHYEHMATGAVLPALAPAAKQAGRYVAKVIAARLMKKAGPAPFRYRDYGTMAVIGRRHCVADLRGWHFTGAIAWYLWLFVHLMQLVAYESRILVFVQWAWHYFTRNRSARLITGEPTLHDEQEVHRAAAASTSVEERASPS